MGLHENIVEMYYDLVIDGEMKNEMILHISLLKIIELAYHVLPCDVLIGFDLNSI